MCAEAPTPHLCPDPRPDHRRFPSSSRSLSRSSSVVTAGLPTIPRPRDNDRDNDHDDDWRDNDRDDDRDEDCIVGRERLSPRDVGLRVFSRASRPAVSDATAPTSHRREGLGDSPIPALQLERYIKTTRTDVHPTNCRAGTVESPRPSRRLRIQLETTGCPSRGEPVVSNWLLPDCGAGTVDDYGRRLRITRRGNTILVTIIVDSHLRLDPCHDRRRLSPWIYPQPQDPETTIGTMITTMIRETTIKTTIGTRIVL